MAYLTIASLIAGLLMYLLCAPQGKAQEIGRMLLFSSILALLITLAPATVHLMSH